MKSLLSRNLWFQLWRRWDTLVAFARVASYLWSSLRLFFPGAQIIFYACRCRCFRGQNIKPISIVRVRKIVAQPAGRKHSFPALWWSWSYYCSSGGLSKVLISYLLSTCVKYFFMMPQCKTSYDLSFFGPTGCMLESTAAGLVTRRTET